MFDYLHRHVQYLLAADPGFGCDWQAHSPRCALLLSKLDREEQALRRQVNAWHRAHIAAFHAGVQICHPLPDFDFLVAPGDRSWVRRCTRANALSLFEYWKRRLTAFLHHGFQTQMVWYGGLKRHVGVWQRIDEWRRGFPLDLWDRVRFRIVAPGIREVGVLVSWVLREFRGQVVRCRNYFVRPRGGPLDPYRAIHIELQSDAEEFVEVQVVTARREAVGLIDHGLVRKRDLPFWGAQHRNWLQRLSWAANLLDCRDAIGAASESLWRGTGVAAT